MVFNGRVKYINIENLLIRMVGMILIDKTL